MSKRQNEAPDHELVYLRSASGQQKIGGGSFFAVLIPEVLVSCGWRLLHGGIMSKTRISTEVVGFLTEA